MANFFIDRPIFAWVLAIILCLTGALAIFFPTGRTIPEFGAAERAHQRNLPRCFGANAGKHRYPNH